MSNETSSTTRSHREQTLHATIFLACTRCGAPGKYLTDDGVKESWPGCYAEQDTLKHDTPVGDICPNCQAWRGPSLVKSLGKIWHRKFT